MGTSIKNKNKTTKTSTPTTPSPTPLTPLAPDVALTTYLGWLTKQPLADNTRRTYRVRVSQYCDFLADYPARYGDYGDPLRERPARDYAVRDFKAHLQTVRHAKPSSVNLTLAALDHF